jgi:molecular chaperone GrpE
MRVVDRRWWARANAAEDEAVEDTRERKPTLVEELEQRLAEAHEQVQAVLNEHRRAADEFEQVKIRLRRDTAREVERGRRAILVEMLDVADNLDRAIDAMQGTNNGDATDTVRRGVELVRDQFLAKLETFGVLPVHALGEPFDPSLHEAVSTAPVADASQHGVVIAVAKQGYAIGDTVLRPASVVVGAHG